MTTLTDSGTAFFLDRSRKFIRSLEINTEAYQLRQMANEADLIDALSSIKYFFHSAVKMREGLNDKSKEDTLKDMEEYLLTGDNEKETALKTRRNKAMFVLIVEPTIGLLNNLTADSLNEANIIVDDVINIVKSMDDYGDYSDALVAVAQIKQLTAEYRASHPVISKAKKPTKSRKRNTFLDEIEADEYTTDKYADDALVALDFD